MNLESLFQELHFDDTQFEKCSAESDVFQDSLEDEKAIEAIYGYHDALDTYSN